MNAKIFSAGTLEAYVLGLTDVQETLQIETMAAASAELRDEINKISADLESVALRNAVAPDPVIKPMLMATIDYMERLQNGEQPTFPQMLHEGSTIDDYKVWLKRADMVLPEDFKDIHVRLIGYTPQSTTAIVWIKEMAPQEVHDNEFERFLIVEGTCNITIDNEIHKLVPGNFLQIPLHKKHHVQVTSGTACKVILQRVAA